MGDMSLKAAPGPQPGKVPVLLLPMSLGIGGAETHVVSLATHLSKNGWDVRVASAGGELVKHLSSAGIEHIETPLDSRSPVSMLSAYRTVDAIVRRRGIGLVHAHARIPAWVAEKICRKRRIPMVMTYHGTFASGAFWRAFTRPGDATVAVSEDIRDYVAREFGFPAGAIEVVANGVDTDHFREPSEADRKGARADLLPSRAPPHVVLYASRLDGELADVAKAVIDACLMVRTTRPGLALIVAGDGDRAEAVWQHASQTNAAAGEAFVLCAGYLPDTFQAYAASDVVVGMSRVALEAMACARPVVIAGPGGAFGPVCPANKDALEERNYTTRNAPSRLSPDLLSSDIDALLGDAVARDELGRFGRRIVLERHSMDLVTRETERIYSRLLSTFRRKS